MKKIQTKSERREFIIGCGKFGVLEFNKALYKSLELSEEELEKLLKKDSEELQEGWYTISSKNGVTYHDKINN